MCVLFDALDRAEAEAEAAAARAMAALDSIRQTKAALAASGPATLTSAPAAPAAPKADSERVELIELKAAARDFKVNYKSLWRWQDNDLARFGAVLVGDKTLLDRQKTAAAIRREKVEKLEKRETRLLKIFHVDLEHEDV